MSKLLFFGRTEMWHNTIIMKYCSVAEMSWLTDLVFQM